MSFKHSTQKSCSSWAPSILDEARRKLEDKSEFLLDKISDSARNLSSSLPQKLNKQFHQIANYIYRQNTSLTHRLSSKLKEQIHEQLFVFKKIDKKILIILNRETKQNEIIENLALNKEEQDKQAQKNYKKMEHIDGELSFLKSKILKLEKELQNSYNNLQKSQENIEQLLKQKNRQCTF